MGTETPGVEFNGIADDLYKTILHPLAEDWRSAKRHEKAALYALLDQTTNVVMREMVFQEPQSPRNARRRLLLKHEWTEDFKSKGVAAGANARYPFNAPFKLALFPDLDWSSETTDPDLIRQRNNATSEISVFANVAAFSIREEVSPSELIEMYGSVRETSAKFKIIDNDETRREEADKARLQKEERDRRAAEAKAHRQLAEQETAAAREREREETKRADANRAEQRKAEAQQRAAEKAARDAEIKRREAEAATQRANKLAVEAEERARKQKEREDAAEAERVEAERKAAEAKEREGREKAEAERREREREAEQTARAEELKRIEADAVERKKEEKAQAKPRRLSSSKDRNEVLEGLDRAWLMVEKIDGDWIITSVQPAIAEIRTLMVRPGVRPSEPDTKDQQPPVQH